MTYQKLSLAIDGRTIEFPVAIKSSQTFVRKTGGVENLSIERRLANGFENLSRYVAGECSLPFREIVSDCLREIAGQCSQKSAISSICREGFVQTQSGLDAAVREYVRRHPNLATDSPVAVDKRHYYYWRHGAIVIDDELARILKVDQDGDRAVLIPTAVRKAGSRHWNIVVFVKYPITGIPVILHEAPYGSEPNESFADLDPERWLRTKIKTFDTNLILAEKISPVKTIGLLTTGWNSMELHEAQEEGLVERLAIGLRLYFDEERRYEIEDCSIKAMSKDGVVQSEVLRGLESRWRPWLGWDVFTTQRNSIYRCNVLKLAPWIERGLDGGVHTFMDDVFHCRYGTRFVPKPKEPKEPPKLVEDAPPPKVGRVGREWALDWLVECGLLKIQEQAHKGCPARKSGIIVCTLNGANVGLTTTRRRAHTKAEQSYSYLWYLPPVIRYRENHPVIVDGLQALREEFEAEVGRAVNLMNGNESFDMWPRNPQYAAEDWILEDASWRRSKIQRFLERYVGRFGYPMPIEKVGVRYAGKAYLPYVFILDFGRDLDERQMTFALQQLQAKWPQICFASGKGDDRRVRRVIASNPHSTPGTPVPYFADPSSNPRRWSLSQKVQAIKTVVLTTAIVECATPAQWYVTPAGEAKIGQRQVFLPQVLDEAPEDETIPHTDTRDWSGRMRRTWIRDPKQICRLPKLLSGSVKTVPGTYNAVVPYTAVAGSAPLGTIDLIAPVQDLDDKDSIPEWRREGAWRFVELLGKPVRAWVTEREFQVSGAPSENVETGRPIRRQFRGFEAMVIEAVGAMIGAVFAKPRFTPEEFAEEQATLEALAEIAEALDMAEALPSVDEMMAEYADVSDPDWEWDTE